MLDWLVGALIACLVALALVIVVGVIVALAIGIWLFVSDVVRRRRIR